MPTPLIILPAEQAERYDFLKSAADAHSLAMMDFPSVFDFYFRTGWVFKGPHFFLMGGHHPERDDAWLVWWAEMHPKPKDPRVMLRILLSCVPYHKPYIAWARTLKGRPDLILYSTARLVSLTKRVPTNHVP